MKKIILILLVAPLLLGCTLANGASTQLPYATDYPSQPLTPETALCTVTAFESLNLRSAPGTSAAVIATLKHGDLLTILPDPAHGNWIYVRAGELQGWVNQNYCKRSNEHE